MKTVILVAAATLLASGYAVNAQDANAEAGATHAEQVCAACHAVLPNEEFSPLPQAPTFQSVADTPGMTDLALTVWLQTSHPTMPNIVLAQDDLRNVVAYIRSLKKNWVRALLRIAFPLVALLLASALPAGALVVMDHLLGKYATTDDGCREGSAEFEIRRGIVEGPNLLCILGAPKQAGPAQEAYEAKCTQKSGVHLGTMTFDLSGKPDSIKITLPESEDWITLYPCK